MLDDHRWGKSGDVQQSPIKANRTFQIVKFRILFQFRNKGFQTSKPQHPNRANRILIIQDRIVIWFGSEGESEMREATLKGTTKLYRQMVLSLREGS